MFESVSVTPHKLLRGQTFSNFQIPKFSNSAESPKSQKIRCPLFFIFSPRQLHHQLHPIDAAKGLDEVLKKFGSYCVAFE